MTAIALRLLASYNRDFYSIALPVIIIGFARLAHTLKYTVTIYFFCFAISQLLAGFYIQKQGGRKILLLALMCFLLGTLLCVFTNYYWPFMFAGRALQAFGIGCLPVLAKAMLARKLKSAKSSFFIMRSIQNILKMIFPILTGILLMIFPWQGVFILVFFWGTSYYLAAIFLAPELYPKQNDLQDMTWPGKLYLKALSDKRSLGYLLSYSLVSGSAYLYTFACAMILTIDLHYAASIVGLFISCFMLAQFFGLAVSQLFRSSTPGKVNLMLTLIGINLTACAMLVTSYLFKTNVYSVMIPAACLSFAQGYSYADFNYAISKKCVAIGSGLIMSLSSALAAFLSAIAICIWTHYHVYHPALMLSSVLLLMFIISFSFYLMGRKS